LTCSPECSRKYRYQWRHRSSPKPQLARCVICGEEFEPVTRHQIICPKESCYLERRRQYWAHPDYYEPNPAAVTGRKKTCASCGKTYSKNRPGCDVTCSPECSAEQTRKRRKEYYTLNMAALREGRKRGWAKAIFESPIRLANGMCECLACGNEFEPTNKEHKTCCLECSVTVVRRRTHAYGRLRNNMLPAMRRAGLPIPTPTGRISPHQGRIVTP
jgi:hypothetical protein